MHCCGPRDIDYSEVKDGWLQCTVCDRTWRLLRSGWKTNPPLSRK